MRDISIHVLLEDMKKQTSNRPQILPKNLRKHYPCRVEHRKGTTVLLKFQNVYNCLQYALDLVFVRTTATDSTKSLCLQAPFYFLVSITHTRLLKRVT